MSEYETALADAKDNLIDSLASALENGVSFARCLEVLGLEGKRATMLRAMLSRYDEAALADMLSGMKENPSIEVSGPELA